MATITFRHGNPVMMDYTPGSAVSAGCYVELGNLVGLTCGVTHEDIAASELGAIGVGGGVYDVKFALCTNVGDMVHYSTGLAALTTNSTNSSQFGYALETTAAVNLTAKAIHVPYVTI